MPSVLVRYMRFQKALLCKAFAAVCTRKRFCHGVNGIGVSRQSVLKSEISATQLALEWLLSLVNSLDMYVQGAFLSVAVAAVRAQERLLLRMHTRHVYFELTFPAKALAAFGAQK